MTKFNGSYSFRPGLAVRRDRHEPVFNCQSRDVVEVANIAGYENKAICLRGCGNQTAPVTGGCAPGFPFAAQVASEDGLTLALRKNLKMKDLHAAGPPETKNEPYYG